MSLHETGELLVDLFLAKTMSNVLHELGRRPSVGSIYRLSEKTGQWDFHPHEKIEV